MPNKDTGIAALGTAIDDLKTADEYINVYTKTHLNAAAHDLQKQAIKNITSRVNLSAAYVRKHTKLVPAKKQGDSLAAGIKGTKRGVLLSRYPSHQLFSRGKNGKRKRHGIAGAILRGRGYSQSKFFYIPHLRNGNGTGIAVRTGRGRSAYKVLHSLSVNQLLSYNAAEFMPAIAEQLEKEIGTAIETYIAGGK